MGDFFNTKIMGLKRLPKKGMEQMRKDFNASLTASTEKPKVKKKRRVRNSDGKLVRS